MEWFRNSQLNDKNINKQQKNVAKYEHHSFMLKCYQGQIDPALNSILMIRGVNF